MAWLKIEEVAKQCGLTKRTIRYYEELGILAPPQRSEGGARLYTEAHIETLKKIMNAKEVLGFSLLELQHFMSTSDMLESQIQDYRNIYKHSTDQMERKSRLIEIDTLMGEQLKLIEQKIIKIHDVRNDIEARRKRAHEAIAKIEENPSK